MFIFVALAWAGAGSALGQNPAVTVSVDAAANRRAINPNVYGVAFGDSGTLADLNAPLNRYGGNNTSRYNWTLNADNRDADYFFESIGDTNSVAGERGDTFITTSRAGGAQPLLTIPMLDWIAKLGPNRNKLASFSQAKYGRQTASDPYFPDAGNGILSSTGQPVTGNDPNDANVPNSATVQDGWVQHLVSTWGTASNGGLKYYLLDNEQSIWFSTHRDVHPTGPRMTEIRDKMLAFANMIKLRDPSALILGPEEWGWSGYFYSGFDQQAGAENGYTSFPDRAANGNMDYLPWLLGQWKVNTVANGLRPLDMFTVHFYPQGGEFGDDTSNATQLLRNRSTRSLWDPTYVDESWINDTVMLIPRLRSWANTYYFSGTPIGLTEYNWGAESHINGATTQADIFGIFGREGLDMAARWTTPDPSTPTYKAMKMYRNYDGNRSTFGDTSVRASVPNPDSLSAFAATRSSDSALTVMVINKDLNNSTPVTLSLANFGTSGTAQVWQLTSANVITRLTDLNYNGGSLNLTAPRQSVTLLVLRANVSNPVLTITKTHTGNFTQGQQNAAYTVTVANATGAGATSGVVTVTEIVPAGISLVSMSGTGWTCAANTCTRTDALAGGNSYPAITVQVNVAANAASPQVNQVTVANGSATASTSDSAVIQSMSPVLSIAKTHSGNFTQGEQDAAFSVVVANAAGAAATSGTVTVMESLPGGLSLVSMSGTGWSCVAGQNSCTRNDALNGGASYPAITVLVNVASNAGSPLTNSVALSYGGGTAGTALDSVTIAPSGVGPGLAFYPLSPCRVADTRATSIMTGGSTRTFAVQASPCGVPASAQAYAMNVTAVPPGPLTYVSIWAAGSAQPVVSTLNATDGTIVANAAIVPAGANGAINVFVSDTSHVVLDINGYFAPPGMQALAFFPLTPCRVADTRGHGGIGAGTSRDFAIRSSSCGVPAAALAYSLNFTAVPPGPLTYLSAWPSGQAQPYVSTLNSVNGRIVANAAIIPAGSAGAVSVYASDATDLVIDINGYFGPVGNPGALLFYPLTPCRVADTRSGPPVSSERDFQVGGSCGLPGSAGAFSLNMTAVPHGPLGYLTTWPTGLAQPVVSTLNSLNGTIVANAAIVPVGVGGAISVFVSGVADVIIDTNGYFAP
ncbi:MAG TPA: glycoside hydrolase family 44 protein [Bryobacteraceae bacterium]|nr:glycoside hydrolase family 44 protein [Bryobacteraceae bacterium]